MSHCKNCRKWDDANDFCSKSCEDKYDLKQSYENKLKSERQAHLQTKKAIESYLSGGEIQTLYNAINKEGKNPEFDLIKGMVLLEELHGLQNGCPLEKYREEWEKCMKETEWFLWGRFKEDWEVK